MYSKLIYQVMILMICIQKNNLHILVVLKVLQYNLSGIDINELHPEKVEFILITLVNKSFFWHI